MIETKNLSIQYVKEFYSLYDFSYQFSKNTLIVSNDEDSRIGLVRCLAGIDKCYQGEILIDDKNIKKIKNKDFDIAYIPTEIYLFKNKNIEKNIEFALKLRKINKKSRNNIINSIISKYNLQYLIKKSIKSLTYSEAKLVMLVRAILRQPKYILLEDYFENLAEKESNISMQILSDVQSHIIACESKSKECYSQFDKVYISNGTKQ